MQTGCQGIRSPREQRSLFLFLDVSEAFVRLVKPQFHRREGYILVNVTHSAFDLLDFLLNSAKLVGKCHEIRRFRRFFHKFNILGFHQLLGLEA
ncbi:hypothetical protein D3C73_1399470 [compost metagenome]